MNVEDLDRNLLVPHYLIHCFIYYELGDSLITDNDFDELAKRLDNEWDSVKHFHKHLIDRDALQSGGSYLRSRYNNRIVYAALHMLRERNRLPATGTHTPVFDRLDKDQPTTQEGPVTNLFDIFG